MKKLIIMVVVLCSFLIPLAGCLSHEPTAFDLYQRAFEALHNVDSFIIYQTESTSSRITNFCEDIYYIFGEFIVWEEEIESYAKFYQISDNDNFQQKSVTGCCCHKMTLYTFDGYEVRRYECTFFPSEIHVSEVENRYSSFANTLDFDIRGGGDIREQTVEKISDGYRLTFYFYNESSVISANRFLFCGNAGQYTEVEVKLIVYLDNEYNFVSIIRHCISVRYDAGNLSGVPISRIENDRVAKIVFVQLGDVEIDFPDLDELKNE